MLHLGYLGQMLEKGGRFTVGIFPKMLSQNRPNPLKRHTPLHIGLCTSTVNAALLPCLLADKQIRQDAECSIFIKKMCHTNRFKNTSAVMGDTLCLLVAIDKH